MAKMVKCKWCGFDQAEPVFATDIERRQKLILFCHGCGKISMPATGTSIAMEYNSMCERYGKEVVEKTIPLVKKEKDDAGGKKTD